jgi:hypothetical protein
MTPTLPHNPEAESEVTAIKALSKPDPPKTAKGYFSTVTAIVAW